MLLFSDTAYPIFHPNGARDWLKATDQNKQAVAAWLDYVELCLRTHAERALEMAFAMKADEIFILTDGAFTDKTTGASPGSGLGVKRLGGQGQKGQGLGVRLGIRD